MFSIVIYSLLSVTIVSLISLVGAITLFLKDKLLDRILIYMVSFSAGALLGGAFIHLIPESFERGIKEIPFYILVGILTFFVTEKIIHWRHCHKKASDNHPHPFSYMILFGDGVHNFIDGLVIGASYLISVPLGISTTLAVMLHEIPQEIGDFGSLIYAGFSKGKALWFNFLSALTAIIGAGLILLIGNSFLQVTNLLIPFTAGGFIYIAVADLIPELHKSSKIKSTILQLVFLILGLELMYLLKILE